MKYVPGSMWLRAKNTEEIIAAIVVFFVIEKFLNPRKINTLKNSSSLIGAINDAMINIKKKFCWNKNK